MLEGLLRTDAQEGVVCQHFLQKVDTTGLELRTHLSEVLGLLVREGGAVVFEGSDALPERLCGGAEDSRR